MKQETVLQTKHLGIQFGALRAVSDFNMELRAGELVGLIGPNGAGKTTVFNLLTGIYTPTEGEIYLCGEKMNGNKTHRFVRKGIARTFQNIRLFKSMTVLENVQVALLPEYHYSLFGAVFRSGNFKKTEAALDKKAESLLQLFSLEEKADYSAGSLSYGEQRKLEIVRALATDMKVLLLDEPAAGMNPTETAQLLECIRMIQKKFGIAILLIEHDMSLVMNVCERIQVISFGETIAVGSPTEIAKNSVVLEAYLGKEDV